MHATGHQGAVRVVRDPPHVAVGPAALRRRVAAAEQGGIAAAPDVVHHAARHDLLAVEEAVAPHHLAQPGQVAQRGVQAAAGKLGAVGVNGDAGIVLGTQPRPEALRQQAGGVLAGGAPHHPGQRVGVDRAVGKLPAMVALFLHPGHGLAEAGRALVARRARQHLAGQHMGPDLGVGVGIVFREAQRGGHVQQLAQRGVTQTAGGQLGHPAGDGAVLSQPALGQQGGTQQADEALGQAHRDVRPVGVEGAEVALMHDAALVQHDDAVGVIAGQ